MVCLICIVFFVASEVSASEFESQLWAVEHEGVSVGPIVNSPNHQDQGHVHVIILQPGTEQPSDWMKVRRKRSHT